MALARDRAGDALVRAASMWALQNLAFSAASGIKRRMLAALPLRELITYVVHARERACVLVLSAPVHSWTHSSADVSEHAFGLLRNLLFVSGDALMPEWDDRCTAGA